MSRRFLTRDQIAVLPTPNEAVYEPPAPTRKPENKACSNCALWVAGGHDRCLIHAKDQVVFGWDNCSYHCSGKPAKRMLPVVMDPPLDPKLSGLGFYPGGTSCSVCAHYSPDATDKTNGDCLRVRQDDRVAYARVEAMGCCGRYVAKPWISL